MDKVKHLNLSYSEPDLIRLSKYKKKGESWERYLLSLIDLVEQELIETAS